MFLLQIPYNLTRRASNNKNNTLVLRVRDVLHEIAPIIDGKSQNINLAKVQKIQTITSDVVLKINTTL